VTRDPVARQDGGGRMVVIMVDEIEHDDIKNELSLVKI